MLLGPSVLTDWVQVFSPGLSPNSSVKCFHITIVLFVF